MSRNIRISEAAWAELVRRSQVEQRTVVTVVDNLLQVSEDPSREKTEGAAGRASASSVSNGVGASAGKATLPLGVRVRPASTGSVAPTQDPSEMSSMVDEMNAVTMEEIARGYTEAITGRFPPSGSLTPGKVCVCGHSAACHKNLTGRCVFGPGCAAGCRGFVAKEELP